MSPSDSAASEPGVGAEPILAADSRADPAASSGNAPLSGASPSPSRASLYVAVALAVVIGSFTAIQARINGTLGQRLDDGIAAAAVSFGTGFLILVLLSVALPAGRSGLRRLFGGIRSGGVPWWMLLGGVCGALVVATQGLTVATIGVALFTVGLVGGQTIGGLLLDRIGFGPGGVVPATLPRVLGGLLTVAAVILLIAGGPVSTALWMLVLPFVAGIGVAWQQGTNGRLRQRVDSSLTATLVNFTGGTIVLVLAAAVNALIAGPAEPLPTEPWLYLGGALGTIYVFIAAIIVRRTGVLVLGLSTVVGLLGTSVLIDVAWPAPSGPSVGLSLVSVAVALVGVTIAVLPTRRKDRTTSV